MRNDNIPALFTKLGDAERECHAEDFSRVIPAAQAELGERAESTDVAGQLDFVATLDLFFYATLNRDFTAPGLFKLGRAGRPAAETGRKAQLAALARHEVGADRIPRCNCQLAFIVKQFLGVENTFTLLADIEKNPFITNLQDRGFYFLPRFQLGFANHAGVQHFGKAAFFVHFLIIKCFVAHACLSKIWIVRIIGMFIISVMA